MNFRRSPLVWAVLLSATVLLASRARALPNLPIILVDQNEGLFGLTLPSVGHAPKSSAKSNQKRATKTMNQLSTQLVRSALTAEFPGKPSTHTAKLIDKLYSGFLGLQATPAGHAPGGGLSALGLYATVSIPTLVAGDTLSLRFSLGSSGYITQLSQHATLDTRNGVSLVVDYSPLPQASATNGSVVAALVRSTGAPTAGVLVIALADSNLPGTLSSYDVTNTDQSGTSVTIPYGVSITGSVSGEHHTGTPELTDDYFAKQGLLGIGVPAAMDAQAASLMNQVR